MWQFDVESDRFFDRGSHGAVVDAVRGLTLALD